MDALIGRLQALEDSEQQIPRQAPPSVVVPYDNEAVEIDGLTVTIEGHTCSILYQADNQQPPISFPLVRFENEDDARSFLAAASGPNGFLPIVSPHRRYIFSMRDPPIYSVPIHSNGAFRLTAGVLKILAEDYLIEFHPSALIVTKMLKRILREVSYIAEYGEREGLVPSFRSEHIYFNPNASSNCFMVMPQRFVRNPIVIRGIAKSVDHFLRELKDELVDAVTVKSTGSGPVGLLGASAVRRILDPLFMDYSFYISTGNYAMARSAIILWSDETKQAFITDMCGRISSSDMLQTCRDTKAMSSFDDWRNKVGNSQLKAVLDTALFTPASKQRPPPTTASKKRPPVEQQRRDTIEFIKFVRHALAHWMENHQTSPQKMPMTKEIFLAMLDAAFPGWINSLMKICMVAGFPYPCDF